MTADIAFYNRHFIYKMLGQHVLIDKATTFGLNKIKINLANKKVITKLIRLRYV